MKIHSQNVLLKNQLEEIKQEIEDFLVFLNSPKFIGVQSDGSRKDWISTGDVIERMKNLRGTALNRID